MIVYNSLCFRTEDKNFSIYHIEQTDNGDGTSNINIVDYASQPDNNYYVGQIVDGNGLTILLIFDLLGQKVAEIKGETL